MLAITPIHETYQTAAELGIREDEREALIWVRGELAYSGLPLDMGAPCGTTCCIGGHVAARLGVDQRRYVVYDAHSSSLLDLFYGPWYIVRDVRDPKKAVRAIDAFMTGAQSRCWHIALEAEA